MLVLLFHQIVADVALAVAVFIDVRGKVYAVGRVVAGGQAPVSRFVLCRELVRICVLVCGRLFIHLIVADVALAVVVCVDVISEVFLLVCVFAGGCMPVLRFAGLPVLLVEGVLMAPCETERADRYRTCNDKHGK